MEGRKELLQDFYKKYSPNQELTDERLEAINKKYGEDDRALLNDFYAKYAPDQELTDDRYNAITSKYSLKKNEKNQLQEEAITEDSSTVAEPLQESGGETNYLVNETAVTRDDLERNLSNDEFIQKVRSGEFNIQVSNDPALEKELENKIKPPSDKAIDKTIQNISGNDESTVKILGRSFQSGLADLSADIYRTPEFIYDVAVNGYNKLLELQDMILPESMESRKIATSEELSEMTGIDNKYAENLEAYAEKKNEINEKYRKPIFESIKQGNISDAALNTAMSVTESLPFMLSMMIPSAAGVKAGKMFLGTTAVMGAGRKQELSEEEGISETQKNANALLYGMAEATDVLMGSGAAGRAIGDVFNKSGKKSAVEFAEYVVEKMVKEKPYLSIFADGFQEAFTTYVQNLSDRATGVDKNKDLTEGVIDAFIVGATMGGMTGGVVQASKITSKLLNNKQDINDINELTKSPQVINEVTGQIDILINTGDLTEKKGSEIKEKIIKDVTVNASIPDNIQSDDRVKAIELQKKYIEVKANQEQASDAFKPLYKGELNELEVQLQELALKAKADANSKESQATPLQKGKRTTVEQYGDKKEVTLKKDFEAKEAEIEKRRQEAKNNPVSEPEEYAKAVDEYKQTELGGGENAKTKKENLVKQAQTKEGKAFVENQVAQLEYNEDGTITVYRSGTMQEGHNPATTNKKTAELIASERKKQGLSSDIIEIKVQPSDISAVVPGVEFEVLIHVNKDNAKRVKENTKKEQKTKVQLELEKESVKNELEKTTQKLEQTKKDKLNGKFPFSDDVYNDIVKKQEAKIKNLEWQLKKYDAELLALEEGQVEGGITKEVETKKEVTSKKQDEQVVILKEDREGGELFPYKGEDYVIQEEFDGQNSAFKIVNSGEVKKKLSLINHLNHFKTHLL